ncbi:MAG: hypothetical protein KAT68_16740 [Bacteroidales bacterium]|nr:hypothetical protein [Bacteroidales bacterium]
MKQTKLIYLFIAVMLYASSSCDKIKTEEDQYPGVSVYKTRGDYFDKVTVGIIKDENRIFRTPYVRINTPYHSGNLFLTETDTIYKFRKKLVNDYVLDGEGDLEHDAFLNISFKELLIWQEKYGETSFCDDTAWKYMLDKDPYIEFYRAKDNEMFLNPTDTSILDTTGLNQIILENRLEEYFTKLK